MHMKIAPPPGDMRVDHRGPSPPEIAIVAGVHGDERSGVETVERILSEDHEFRRGVKFIVANEAAVEANERYVEADLNRVAPGDPFSDVHEERLAAELVHELVGLTVLDLHSTVSSDEPFAIFSAPLAQVSDALRWTGVDHAADISVMDGGMDAYYAGIVLEVGPQGSQHATESAYRVTMNFLRNAGALDGNGEPSDPHIYRIEGPVEKEDDWEFTAENLHPVAAGEEFARSADGPITADERFHPILMSTDGYDDILGFRATEIGRLSTVDIGDL